MYCLWIAKDPDDYTAASRLGTLTLESSNAETKDDSLGEVKIVKSEFSKISNQIAFFFKTSTLHLLLTLA